MISGLDYDIKFPVTKKDYCWAEKKNSICINVFCYKMGLVHQFMYWRKNLKIA